MTIRVTGNSQGKRSNMRREWFVTGLLCLGAASSLAAQQATPLFDRWEASGSSFAMAETWAAPEPDSVPSRGDYRYEGLVFGGVAFGTLGAWIGSRDFATCPLEPGVPCGNDNKLGDAIVAGLAGAAIGGTLGYLVGRFSPKKPRPPVILPSSQMTTVPDSVRQRIGYQHWRGAKLGLAIGGLVGALGGAVIGSISQCDDCTEQPTAGNGALVVGLLGAGTGGVLGFLAGLASPRYVWVPSDGPAHQLH